MRKGRLKFSFRTTLEYDSSEDYGPTTRWRWHLYHQDKNFTGYVEPHSSDQDTKLERMKQFLKEVEPNNSMFKEDILQEETQADTEEL